MSEQTAHADRSNGSRRPQRVAALSLLVLSAVAFASIRLPFVSLPLERDEGEYAYIAQQMLRGYVPYADAFDQKPPGVFAVYAVAFTLFGESIESIHLFLYAWTAAAALLLFLVVRRLTNELSAAFATLAFAVSSGDPTLLGTAANTEHFMLLPILGSMWMLLRAIERDTAGAWFATGVLAASACWFKQVAIANALFIAVCAAATGWRNRRSLVSTLRSLTALGLGAVVVSLPVFAIFAWAGAWDSFLDSVFIHNFSYAREVPLPQAFAALTAAVTRQCSSQAALWVLAALSLLFVRSVGTRAMAILLGWQLASFVGVSFGFYFRPHYFLQQLPSLCALVGVAAGGAVSWAVSHRHEALGWVLVALSCGLIVAPVVYGNRSALFADDVFARSRDIYGNNPFPESLEIARYIERTSRPDESIYIVGSEPQIFFYSRRRSATRYIFFYPMTSGSPEAAERQRATSREVATRRPRYLIWMNIAPSLLLIPDTDRHVFEAASRLTEEGYELEFAAFPRGASDPYQFVYGSRAVRELARVRSAGNDPSWIAVYRRLDPD